MAKDKAQILVDRVLPRINWIDELTPEALEADLMVESIDENLELKQVIFAEYDQLFNKNCIFTTNTSSLSVQEIASVCSPERQARFGGLHFFNPVGLMRLLEVVKIENITDDAVNESLMNFGKKINKITVQCQDTSGFFVNRLLYVYFYEAFRMRERGVASLEDIDKAMHWGAGYPMGPFRLADYIGLDICQTIMDLWRAKEPDNPLFARNQFLDDLVEQGHLGVKTGHGFYKYEKAGSRVIKSIKAAQGAQQAL